MHISELIISEESQLLVAPMLEMANFQTNFTGLPVVIWMGRVGGQHGPRIKVSNLKGKFAEDDNFVVSIDKEPKILTPSAVTLKSSEVEEVKDWIRLNHDGLLLLWDHYETGKGELIPLLSNLRRL